MRTFTKVDMSHNKPEKADYVVKLPYDKRQQSRFKTFTTTGEEVGIILPRGQSMKLNSILLDENGQTLLILGQEEPLTCAICDQPLLWARASYHLGNRHTPVEIRDQRIFFQPDHVLEHMLEHLHVSTYRVNGIFNPEDGAYSHGGHHHHD